MINYTYNVSSAVVDVVKQSELSFIRSYCNSNEWGVFFAVFVHWLMFLILLLFYHFGKLSDEKFNNYSFRLIRAWIFMGFITLFYMFIKLF